MSGYRQIQCNHNMRRVKADTRTSFEIHDKGAWSVHRHTVHAVHILKLTLYKDTEKTAPANTAVAWGRQWSVAVHRRPYSVLVRSKSFRSNYNVLPNSGHTGGELLQSNRTHFLHARQLSPFQLGVGEGGILETSDFTRRRWQKG